MVHSCVSSPRIRFLRSSPDFLKQQGNPEITFQLRIRYWRRAWSCGNLKDLFAWTITWPPARVSRELVTGFDVKSPTSRENLWPPGTTIYLTVSPVCLWVRSSYPNVFRPPAFTSFSCPILFIVMWLSRIKKEVFLCDSAWMENDGRVWLLDKESGNGWLQPTTIE